RMKARVLSSRWSMGDTKGEASRDANRERSGRGTRGEGEHAWRSGTSTAAGRRCAGHAGGDAHSRSVEHEHEHEYEYEHEHEHEEEAGRRGLAPSAGCRSPTRSRS